VKLIYDLRILSPKMHGMTRYGLELLKAIMELDSELGIGVLIVKPEHGELLPKDPRLVSIACGLSPYGPRAQFTLPKILNALRGDVYLCPFFGPPARFKGPMVVTIHDLIHLRFAKDYGLKQKLYYRFVVGPAARKARAVFTVSEHSKKDIVELLGVDPEKIIITPNGVDSRFKPLDKTEKQRAREKLGWPKGYLLGVGNKKPHKNLKSLIKAHGMLKGIMGEQAPALVLVGVKSSDFPQVRPGPDLIFCPALDDEKLRLAYGAAKAVVMPSLYEGFGLPALEAMASGAPVLASDQASLPEVVGQAGVLTRPEPEPLAQAVCNLLENPEEMKRLVKLGPEQAARFTWRKSAETALNALKTIASRGSL
jgi:glycosyltransferase involved in cell wall biosynthesis